MFLDSKECLLSSLRFWVDDKDSCVVLFLFSVNDGTVVVGSCPGTVISTSSPSSDEPCPFISSSTELERRRFKFWVVLGLLLWF